MKNLEKLIMRQLVYALVPLADMTCRSGHALSTMPMPISLAGIK